MDNTKETKETDLNRGNKAGSVDMFIRDVNESKYPNATEARKALRHWTWLTRTEADDVKEYIDQHFKVGAHAPRVKTRTKSANVPSRDQDTGPCADENSKKEPGPSMCSNEKKCHCRSTQPVREETSLSDIQHALTELGDAHNNLVEAHNALVRTTADGSVSFTATLTAGDIHLTLSIEGTAEDRAAAVQLIRDLTSMRRDVQVSYFPNIGQRPQQYPTSAGPFMNIPGMNWQGGPTPPHSTP